MLKHVVYTPSVIGVANTLTRSNGPPHGGRRPETCKDIIRGRERSFIRSQQTLAFTHTPHEHLVETNTWRDKRRHTWRGREREWRRG